MKGNCIVCVSTHYWKEPWFRKQQFMSRLSAENRVLYVEPSFSMVRKAPHQFAHNSFVGWQLSRHNNNLWILTPPRRLPKYMSPFIAPLDNAWLSLAINYAIKKLGFSNIILWLYNPLNVSLIKKMPHRWVVFDMCDDYPSYNFNNIFLSNYTLLCTKALINKADLVLATTDNLRRKYSTPDKEIKVVSNGVDEKFFVQPTGNAPFLNEIVVGFVGVLFKFLDYDKLRRTIIENPNWHFHFIGRVEDRIGVKKISEFDNVSLSGHIEQSQIPYLIGKFRVCLNPFLVNETSKYVNPLKVYEYLAMGKPVVSPYMEALIEIMGKDSDLISWSEPGDESYTKAINVALAQDSPSYLERRRNFAKLHSWENKYKELINYLSVLE